MTKIAKATPEINQKNHSKKFERYQNQKRLMPLHINSALDYVEKKLKKGETTPELNRLFRLEECSNQLIKSHLENEEIKINTLSCKIRFCPVCELKKSLKRAAQLFAILPIIEEKYPDSRWIFFTVTIKNCSPKNLEANFRRMSKAWKRLHLDRVQGFLGWIKHFEVTEAKDGKAHPHFHCLILTDKSYSQNIISHSEWVQKWQRAMKINYKPNVDIREIKSKTNPKKAILETIKYSIKPSDLISPFSVIARNQLSGKRLYSTSKIINELVKDFEISEEQIKIILNQFFTWSDQQKNYIFTHEHNQKEIEELEIIKKEYKAKNLEPTEKPKYYRPPTLAEQKQTLENYKTRYKKP